VEDNLSKMFSLPTQPWVTPQFDGFWRHCWFEFYPAKYSAHLSSARRSKSSQVRKKRTLYKSHSGLHASTYKSLITPIIRRQTKPFRRCASHRRRLRHALWSTPCLLPVRVYSSTETANRRLWSLSYRPTDRYVFSCRYTWTSGNLDDSA